jgi:hypothetical protein
MSSVDVHKRIKKALHEIERDSPYACHNVELIAEKAGTDTRTAKNHLCLLEADGFGKFCDPKKKTFVSKEKIGCTIE